MKKSPVITILATLFLGLCFCFTKPVTAADKCTTVNVKGSFTTQGKQALAVINEFRKESCDNGYQDPRDPDKALTPEDYVPMKWSETLEEAAQIRAAESLLEEVMEPSGDLNLRPNGTSCDTVLAPYFEGFKYNYKERIEYGIDAISMLYEGHDTYENGAGFNNYYRRVYGYMINPDNTYVATASFDSDLTDEASTCLLFFGSTDAIPEELFHKDLSTLASHRTQAIEILKSAIDKKVNPNIVKETQKLKVSTAKKSVSYKKCKKVAQKTSKVSVTGAKGKVTYKKVSGSSRLKIGSTTGKITVSKKTKKGTYSIKIKVTAASKGIYAKTTKTLTIKVKVK